MIFVENEVMAVIRLFKIIVVGIFCKCALGRAIRKKTLDIPNPQNLPDSDVALPFVVLGDEAFPLLENLMKPYPRSQSFTDIWKAVFNYRLSRARRIVENAFGILTHRFRILNTPIHLDISSIEDAVTVACILHNILIDEKVQSEPNAFNSDFNDLECIETLEEIVELEGSSDPREIRDKFKDYFNTIGAVSWQNETIRL